MRAGVLRRVGPRRADGPGRVGGVSRHGLCVASRRGCLLLSMYLPIYVKDSGEAHPRVQGDAEHIRARLLEMVCEALVRVRVGVGVGVRVRVGVGVRVKVKVKVKGEG